MSEETPILAPKNPTVYVVQHNHFDPIWRRCWDRTFDYRGQRFRSYAEVEERVFNIWLESARKGATFSEGQAVVVRKFLHRNPERLEEMRDLVNRGILELTAAGESVADTNLPSGETLLRNLVMGQRWFEETFGVIPNVGWLEDAFGQSAQMPQLFRGVECPLILGISYKRVPGNYWRGLDGSVVFTGDAPYTSFPGNFVKIRPCDKCSGFGCEVCENTGLGAAGHITDDAMRNAFAEDYSGYPFARITVGGEETIPNPNIAELLEEARKQTGKDFRFGGFASVADELSAELARIDDPELQVSNQVEANPVSTGCYVTRIAIKQEFRRLENLVNTAERWATVAHLLGAEYPDEALTQAWRDLVFVAFHDAITSTHLDQPYCELLDMLADSECEASCVLEESLDVISSRVRLGRDKHYLMVFNSDSWERDDPVTATIFGAGGRPILKDARGKELEVLDANAEGLNLEITFRPPKVPALGYAVVELTPDAEPLDRGEVTSAPGYVENEFFKVGVGRHGISSILDKRLGKEIVDPRRYLCNELILEEDIGHPWGTMQPPSFEERLGPHTTEVKIRRARNVSEVVLVGQYKGNDPGTKLLAWRQVLKLYKGVNRIDFRTEIEWDTAQRRIRVAFPTNIKTDDAFYAIPYGALKRGGYAPEMDRMPSTNGDWPAINWVDVYSEAEDRGVALINTGTPSHKVLDGVIFMSVLRSPTDSWCLNEPEFYDCPDFDGARDAGGHEFTYSLISHQGDHRRANIEKRGCEVNNPMLVRMPAGSGRGKLGLERSFINLNATENVVVTAVKKSDRDDSIVVRLAETAGSPGEAVVSVEAAGTMAEIVNFLERHPMPVRGKIKLGPFKIITVRLRKA